MFKKIYIPIYFIVFIGLAYVLFFRDTTKHPDWHPFNETIFNKAKRENKLIVLHLSANWSHLSHLMEKHTYANPLIIDYLEKNYITCKENLDQRLDLNSLAKKGVPTTIIFDADGNELLNETGYIDNDRFMATLTQLKDNPTRLPKPTLLPDFSEISDSTKEQSLKLLKEKLKNSIDIEEGGFNFGPKYIDFNTFEYAFNQSRMDTSLYEWVENSIINSTSIYDNTWGGVYQFAANNDWKQIQYEKLLEIQARYIKMYCWYYNRYKDVDALKKAEGIAAYVQRFLSARNGAYYNAQDADLKPGQKSSIYFALNNDGRIAQGIPAIDKHIYTNSNAEIAEAFLILWATNNNPIYLDKAVKCVNVLRADHKKVNSYMHSDENQTTIYLKDNLSMLKILLLMYRATSEISYKKDAAILVREISYTFDSGKGYLNSYIGNTAIKSTFDIAENIEACRLLNYCSYVFKNPSYRNLSVKLFHFLTNPELVKSFSTEAGILSAAMELSEEPSVAVYMSKSANALQEAYTKSCIAFPKFYFYNETYTEKTIVSDKINLFESYNKNFMIVCSSVYYSSPLFTIDKFNTLLFSRLLNDTKK